MLHPNCWSACTISVTWLQCAVHRAIVYRCVASPALHVLLIGQSQKHCVVTQFRVYCIVAVALCFKKERRHYYTEIKTFHNVKLKSISIVQLTHKTIVYQNPKKISSISKHPIEETTADKYSFRSTQIVFISKASQFWPTKNRVKKNLLDKAKESPVQETIYYPNGLEQQSQKRQISDRK